MAALTTERDTSEIANGAKRIKLPVKGKTTIFQGAIVAIGADGYAVPASKLADLTVAGRAEETVANTGADGAESILVARGVFIYENSASGKLDATHVLKPCYIEDDQTVSKTDTGSSVAGLVIRVDDEGVAVEMGFGLTAPSAAAAKTK